MRSWRQHLIRCGQSIQITGLYSEWTRQQKTICKNYKCFKKIQHSDVYDTKYYYKNYWSAPMINPNDGYDEAITENIYKHKMAKSMWIYPAHHGSHLMVVLSSEEMTEWGSKTEKSW